MTMTGRPDEGILTSVRVLDLTRDSAGSLAAALLSDYGADVVKVVAEDPRPRRGADLPEWIARNRGKRLALADQRTPQVQAEIARLVDECDVVIVDSHATLVEVGLDLESVGDRHVVLVTPPYSADGAPWAGEHESTALLEAVTGIAAYQASYSGAPVTAVYPYLARIQGVWAAASTVAALTEFRRSQLGQVVTVDGLHAAALFGDAAFTRPVDEPDADRGIGPEGLNPMYTRYQGADGEWVFVGGLGPKFANTVVDVVGVRDILDDPRVDGRIERLWHIDNSRWVLTEFQEKFRTRSAAEWVEIFEENDVPCALLGRREGWFRSEQMDALHQRVLAEDPVLGPIELTGPIVDSTATPAVIEPTREPQPLAEIAWRQRSAIQAVPSAAQVRSGEGPLAGLRAVVFGSYVAGPYVGKLLAEFGMEAVKIEPLAGDPWRMQGFGINRGYRSLSLSLAEHRGRKTLERVLASADVVVDNFRVGVTERLGLTHESLSALRPGIVSVSVTAYGERGPLSHKPGYDPVVQAASGMMLAQGGDDEPVAYSMPPNDLTTAVCGAFAAVLGVFEQQTTGRGQHLSTALATTAVFLQSGDLVNYEGRPPGGQGGRDFPGASPTDRYYRVADGHVRIEVDAIDVQRWVESGLDLDGDRVTIDPERELDRVLAPLSRDEAVARLTEAGVPAVPARTPREVSLDDYLHERRVLGRFTSSTGERFVTTNRLVDFERTPVQAYMRAPGLGEHSTQILRELGESEPVLEDLVARGIVLDGTPLVEDYLPPYR